MLGTAVRSQAKNNNDFIKGVKAGALIDTMAITQDKLNVDNNITIEKYTYSQEAGATVAGAHLTYIHEQTATEVTLKCKIVCLTNIPNFKAATRVSGTSYLFGEWTNLKLGDEIYINKTITIPTSSEGTIRALFVINNTTEARSFEVINPIFTQDNVTNPVGTYGYETSGAGTCEKTEATYKALATKEFVENLINSGSIFSSMNFGCSGDSITAEPSGTNQWPYYVCNELSLQNKHNTAVGSSTYAFKKVTYQGVEYTPQNYNDVNFAGYSTKSPTQVQNATEAQQVANNCAKNHIEQFIAEVNAGTFPTPNIFIFAYGTNDNPLNVGSVEEAFSNTLENIDKFTLAGGMRYAVEKITTAYPNCKCFVLNILQSAYEGYQSRPNQILKNNVIKEVADYFSIPVIDQFDNCGITRLYEVAGTQGRYLSDGLHPNVTGRKKQAEFIVRELKNKTTENIS